MAKLHMRALCWRGCEVLTGSRTDRIVLLISLPQKTYPNPRLEFDDYCSSHTGSIKVSKRDSILFKRYPPNGEGCVIFSSLRQKVTLRQNLINLLLF